MVYIASGGSPIPEVQAELTRILQQFDGEPSLKRVFWEVLSYDRVREPLSLRLLPPSAASVVRTFEVFAESDSLSIIHVELQGAPAGWQLELMAGAARRNVSDCVLIVNDGTAWTLVYPDETKSPRIRILPLPGPADQREQTARALLALNAADDDGEPVSRFEQAEQLESFFPGTTPNLSDIIDDFARLERHHDPQVRELRWYMRLISAYPLLTAKQERGEDLWGDATPSDEQLELHHQRLVLHNLRLVVWMAMKVRRVGITVIDLVQEGNIGLMRAARRYERDRGNRFTTMAFWWVRQAMYRAMHNQCNLIRWPVWIAVRLIKNSGDEAGLTPGQKPVIYLPCSLTAASLRSPDFIDEQAKTEIATAVRATIANLRRSQTDVLIRRFGIGCDEQTLEENGQSYGVTRERIRQIEAKGLTRLAHTKWATQLDPYTECSRWRVARAIQRPKTGHGPRNHNASNGRAAAQPEPADVRQIATKYILVDGALQAIRVFEPIESFLTRKAAADAARLVEEATNEAIRDSWRLRLATIGMPDDVTADICRLLDLQTEQDAASVAGDEG